jgi:transcriptional regulator with XRE-family HTH domain
MSPISEADIALHVGARLRRRRRLLSLSQQEVATACGVGFQQIQKYEAGTQIIAAERLWRAAKVLGVPMSYFYDGLAMEEGATPPRRRSRRRLRGA